MTREAVQQRFGGRPEDGVPDSRERRLGPVTVFDEMAELELAGGMGWRAFPWLYLVRDLRKAPEPVPAPEPA